MVTAKIASYLRNSCAREQLSTASRKLASGSLSVTRRCFGGWRAVSLATAVLRGVSHAKNREKMREREEERRRETSVPASTRATFLSHVASCLLGLLPGIGSPFYGRVSLCLHAGEGERQGPGSGKSRGTFSPTKVSAKRGDPRVELLQTAGCCGTRRGGRGRKG